VAQRGDVTSLCINHQFDPQFSAAMDEALAAGVEVIALKLAVTPQGFGPPIVIPTELP
jgi:DNA-binding sugar fermentation-stimulating protein